MTAPLARRAARCAPAALALALALAACASGDGPRAEAVPPAPDDGSPAGEDVARPPADGVPSSDAPRSLPGAGDGGGPTVVDAQGVVVGRLFRRGSDDNLASRAIYDLVTVVHPESGLFFEITLTDGVVRMPATTYFKGAFCDEPVGISAGGCTGCRSGPGIGVLHGGAWYVVESGVTSTQAAAGSTLGSGVDEGCVAHGVTNARVFPLRPVAGPTPPTSFAPPLSIAWR